MTSATQAEPQPTAHDDPDAVLRVSDLTVTFPANGGRANAIDRVSLCLARGRCLALVGESGCGKSVTALSIMGLLDPPGRIESGTVELLGERIDQLPENERARLRGDRMAMIFQEPMTALNPVMRIGEQVAEPLRWHRNMDAASARQQTIELLARVGMPAPEERYACYPHQLSGGLRQRVVIAMALACEPDLLIADEPTTALDVTLQAQMLALLARLQRERAMAMLFITHDLGLLSQVADEVAVMYAGRIVERGTTAGVLRQPRHPYTSALLASVPRTGEAGRRLPVIPGQVPDLSALPAGCAFQPRCALAEERCATERPQFENGVACFFPIDSD